MSTYRFQMKDFLAVKKADIEIDDLTVLAGPNASGKSTISRWLVNIFDLLIKYEQKVMSIYYNDVIEFFRILDTMAFNDTATFGGLGPDISEYIKDLEKRVYNNLPYPDLDHLAEDFREFLRATLDAINLSENEEEAQTYLQKLLKAFHISIPTEEGIAIPTAEREITAKVINFITQIQLMQTSREIDNLQPIIDRSTYSYEIDQGEMELEEEGVVLLGDKTFTKPTLTLRAIYISTQNIGESLQPYHLTPLARLLQTRNKVEPNDEVRKLITIIRHLIGGRVEEDRRELIGRRKELQFVMKSGKAIPLRRAATGIISLGYLLQLLENGWLTRGTLLVIDEPEGHLHPQWIVEYARLLVLLAKNIGVKIMVSSHNPDMVAAIQSIAYKEEIIDNTRFYLAVEDKEAPASYIYKDLGQEIGEIFHSFNIAQSRIEYYGC